MQNVKKMQEKQLKESEEASSVAVAANGTQLHTQVAGPRCRTLYSGSKLFWRTQNTYDIDIYLHLSAKCVEVISYDAKNNIELPRLYFSESLLIDILGDKKIKDKAVEKKRQIAASKISKGVAITEELFQEDEKRLAISTYLLQHLTTTPPPATVTATATSAQADGSVTSKSPSIYFDGAGITDKSSPLLHELPAGMMPVHIPRRRQSSELEIENTIQDINKMTKEISSLSSAAENISNLFNRGMEALKQSLKMTDVMASYTIPRRRWIYAINRVLRINLVAKNTKYLKEKYPGKYL